MIFELSNKIAIQNMLYNKSIDMNNNSFNMNDKVGINDDFNNCISLTFLRLNTTSFSYQSL